MANIKISELNSLTDKAYDDLIPIVDSSANETKKISIDKLVDNNVELIAVSNDAPSECSIGDKYYNKTTNKIYTATGTDTWGTTGEDAIEGILYIVFEEQTTYAYDGETLVSVGGGAGTYVGDVPPEEPKENDLWVDTNDEEHLAEVDDEVSTTSTNAIQNQAITNYVNGLNTYSEAETAIGKWIDGRTIYRKVIILENVAISASYSTQHNISNFDKLIKIDSMYWNSSNSRTFPPVQNTGALINVVVTPTNITFYGNFTPSGDFMFILYYVKTTN